MKYSMDRLRRTILVLFVTLAMFSTVLSLDGMTVYADDGDTEATAITEASAEQDEAVADETLPAEDSGAEPAESPAEDLQEKTAVTAQEEEAADEAEAEPAAEEPVEAAAAEETKAAATVEESEEAAAAEGSEDVVAAEEPEAEPVADVPAEAEKPVASVKSEQTASFQPVEEDTTIEETVPGSGKAGMTAKPAALRSASLSATTFTYNGKTRTPDVTVYGKAGTAALKKNIDYTVKVSGGHKNAGSYTVTITGKGNYTGTITKTFTIKPASLKSLSLSKTSFTYNGKVKEPKVKVYGKVFRGSLKEGKDYTVKLSRSRKKVGKYTVTVTGKGNYKGTLSKTFVIKPAKASLKSRKLSCGVLKESASKKASSYGGGYFQIAYRKPGGKWKYVTVKSKSEEIPVAEANTYYLKVRAVKKTGGKTYKGAWSKTYKVVNKIPVRVQKVLNAANRTPFAGQGWCAAWVCNVFDRSGVMRSARMPYASDYYRHYCFSSNKADLRPGMIVASRLSYAGGYAGHIGIYIGNGKVISNETCITIKTVDEFAATYGHGYPIRWGWMNNKKLL